MRAWRRVRLGFLPRVAVLALVALVASAAPVAADELAGVVFVDLDGDGQRGEGEGPRAGVVVSNGVQVARTDAEGRYRLPAGGAGFVAITCPADGRCPRAWARGASDFGVVPRAPEQDLFFVHVTDAHVYPRVEDLASTMPQPPGWLPDWVVGWLLLRRTEPLYGERTRDEVVAALRAAAAPHRDVEGVSGPTALMRYLDAALDPTTGLIRPREIMPAAFAEVAALRPAFVVSTGDLILEGNAGEPEQVERWYAFYQELQAATGIPFYVTIGNNELGGTENPRWRPDDPGYGKALFRGHFGPTRYSFERGPFHFVALDTHVPAFDVAAPFDPGEEQWDFGRMTPAVRAWLDADLAAAAEAGRVPVVLNHEPFHSDPAWGLDDYEPADDEGLFARYGVRYALAGHVHRNGFEDGPTTHITTGALSGFRWLLPEPLQERGYRLFHSSTGPDGPRLHSAWKPLGRPALGFVDPRGAAALHPASRAPADPRALAADADGRVEVVAVAADVAGPFASVSLALGDRPLPVERWGDYFLRAHFELAALPEAGGVLVLRARDGAGRVHERALEVARAAPTP